MKWWWSYLGQLPFFVRLLGYVLFFAIWLSYLPTVGAERVVFDLSTYNKSDETTHSWKNNYTINETVSTIYVMNVHPDVAFFVVEIHSFINNVTVYNNDKHVNGTNVGLVQMINGSHSYTFDITTEPNLTTNVLFGIVAYGEGAPVPGGCSMTFDFEISPYQVITYTRELITVDSQAASVENGICDERSVSLEMYHIFLREWDFTKEEYFRGIEKMMTVRDIVKYGRKVPEPYASSYLRRYYNAYVGTGSVFAIIAKHGNFSSAYIPAVTYSCDIKYTHESCRDPASFLWSWVLVAILVIGFYITFNGHNIFRFTLFMVGLLVGNFLLYITFVPELSDVGNLVLYGVLGIIFGIVWVGVWEIWAKPVLSSVLTYVTAGYLVGTVILYSGLADHQVIRNDINYWLVLTGITLTVSFMLSFTSFLGNIVACSFIGSYAFIIAVDHFIGSNLQYIVITAARRATIPHYNEAVIDPPYQNKDTWLSLIWLLMVLYGMYKQWPRNKRNERLGMISERTPLFS